MKEYFDNAKGAGILATADEQGKVDVAIHAKPHFMDDGTIALEDPKITPDLLRWCAQAPGRD